MSTAEFVTRLALQAGLSISGAMSERHWTATARRLLAMDEPARAKARAAMEPEVREALKAQVWLVAEASSWPRA